MRSATHLCNLAEEAMEWSSWYSVAQRDITDVCAHTGWDFDRFVDVLAITSPRVSVRRNIRVAMHYMQTGEYLSGTIRSTLAAMLHYEETGEIRGPKTSAFSRALKGDLDAIVLDVWMSKAFEIDQRTFDRKDVRLECERRVCRAAARHVIRPAELQAASWAAIVRRHGRNTPSFDVSSELTLFDT